jgi:hypothetical protein
MELALLIARRYKDVPPLKFWYLNPIHKGRWNLPC